MTTGTLCGGAVLSEFSWSAVAMSKAVVPAPPAAWAWVAAPWSARHGIILGVPIPLTAG